MRRSSLALVLLAGLGLVVGCASTRDAIAAFFAPKEKLANDKKTSYSPGLTKAEREQQEYERDPQEYLAKKSSKSLWDEGYGFNNPNGDLDRRRSENNSPTFMMGHKYPVPSDPLPP